MIVEVLIRRSLDARACAVALALGLAVMLSTSRGVAKADQIYNVTAAGSDDFVPFENDGTPNRPNGDHMGNEITFAGTARDTWAINDGATTNYLDMRFDAQISSVPSRPPCS